VKMKVELTDKQLREALTTYISKHFVECDDIKDCKALFDSEKRPTGMMFEVGVGATLGCTG
jgi:hypothetical protein